MTRWSPHAGLGPLVAGFEDALSAGRFDDAEARLSGAAETSGLLAARYSLAAARGAAPAQVEPLADAAVAALRAEGHGEAATLVLADAAAVLASGRGGTRRADALVVDPGASPRVRAAVLRAKGVAARVGADLGTAIHALEASLSAADESGDVREVLRSKNALGTAYASLGVTVVARLLLVEARELAEVSGEAQSLAIAHGQLAVLEMDAGRHDRAVAHLAVSLDLSRRAGDVHGEARALALLAEARAVRGDVAGARAAAHSAREVHRVAPTPWTRLSAVLATLSEVEDARLAGDEIHAAALLADLGPDLEGDDDAHRVVRAKLAFTVLADPALPDGERFARARVLLARSPRPVWVERALSFAAGRAGGPTRRRLLERVALVMDARALAASPSLVRLRAADPELARDRARVLGRSLLLAARTALLPTGAYDAFAGEVADLDRGLSTAFGPIPDDLVVSRDGRLVSSDEAALRARTGEVAPVRAEVVAVAGELPAVVCTPR